MRPFFHRREDLVRVEFGADAWKPHVAMQPSLAEQRVLRLDDGQSVTYFSRVRRLARVEELQKIQLPCAWTIWTQIREAAGGGSERGANLGKSRLLIRRQSAAHCPGRLKPRLRNAGTVRRLDKISH
jgi:hypothetical protein